MSRGAPGERRTVPLVVAVVAPLFAAAVAVVVGLILTGAIGPGESSAEAGGQNRAVVVVDTGSSVRAACVLFSEDSISGAEALTRAGMDPVFQGYSGLGGGVCALNGVGCPSDGSCLTCQAPSYWSYWRSSGGGYSYSAAGASSTSVTDGSVEGWSWARNSSDPPPFRSVDSVCGAEEPPPTTPPATQPPAQGGGGGSGGGGGGSGGAVVPGGGPTPTTPEGEPVETTTTAPGETTTTTTGEDDTRDGASTSDASGGEDEGGDETASTVLDEDDGGAGAAGSIALATAAVAAIGFFVWRARRRNHLVAAGAGSLDAEGTGAPLERLDDGQTGGGSGPVGG